MKYVTLTVVLLLTSAAAAAMDLETLEGLLDAAGNPAQIGDTAAAAVARVHAQWAQREMNQGYGAAADSVRDPFAATLHAALNDVRPTVRAAAVRALAVKPVPQDVGQLLTALRTEQDTRVRRALLHGIVDGVRQLALGDRVPLAASAATLFEGVIRAKDLDPEVRNTSVIALGRLGPVSLGPLRALQNDPQWGPILHSTLPSAFAETKDTAAVADILALYATDAGTGFRMNCLHALGALVRSATAEPGALQPAIDLLRTVALESESAALASAACLAYCRWPGAGNDGDVAALIPAWIDASTRDQRKRYLRALAAIRVPLDAQTRSLIESIAVDDTETGSNRKIASSILTTNAGRL